MSYRGPTQPQGFEDASVWRVKYERNQWLVYCNVCRSTGQTPYNANSHKKTAKHLANVARLRSSQSQTPTTSTASDTNTMSSVPPAVPIIGNTGVNAAGDERVHDAGGGGCCFGERSAAHSTPPPTLNLKDRIHSTCFNTSCLLTFITKLRSRSTFNL
ncbi:hypothetical protein EV361DRAFT_134151 [Lentinula raphanica]|nr:hypothetical protein EV361DRAFT_134151 [Lentinula raphanica]